MSDVARAPVAPATIQRSAAPTVGGEPAHGAPTAASLPTISAAELAAQLMAAPAGVQRRSGGAVLGGHRARPTIDTGAAASGGPATTPAAPGPSGSPSSPPATGGGAPFAASASPNSSAFVDAFDELLARLEDRVIMELERRGGRFRGGL
jgi:hypothetical protein